MTNIELAAILYDFLNKPKNRTINTATYSMVEIKNMLVILTKFAKDNGAQIIREESPSLIERQRKAKLRL